MEMELQKVENKENLNKSIQVYNFFLLYFDKELTAKCRNTHLFSIFILTKLTLYPESCFLN